MNNYTSRSSDDELSVALPAQWHSLAHAFLLQARSRPNQTAVADSTGACLTYRQLLVASIAVANELKHTVNNGSNTVGILLPPSVAATIANVSIVLLGKIPVNLNYTNGQQQFDSTIATAGIKQVISSARVLEKLHFKCSPQLLLIEDVKEDIGLLHKVKAWSEAEIVPTKILSHLFNGLETHRSKELPDNESCLQKDHQLPAHRLQDPAAIIFTSGSTADPKGVVLSHSNILSNIHAIRMRGQVSPGEIVLGVVPFFHSFGFTMTLWAPLCLGEAAVYHYDPFDARLIGDLCQKFSATMLVCTPTMLAFYLRRCKANCFSSVTTFVVGGEKLKKDFASKVEEMLGVIPLEGYGLAETAPVISCNVDAFVSLPDGRMVPGIKKGTVGLPLPGTKIRVVDPDSGIDLPTGAQGLILVKGPQVMMGYLQNHDSTAKAFRDGWLITGDLGFLDCDGFLTITGRLSQFAKIAGEMVPHLAIEEEILRVAGCLDQTVSVTSIPDDKRGEKLVVVYSDLCDLSPGQVVDRLKATNICRLWIPDAANFIRVDDMPHLRNGKLDLRRIHEIASAQIQVATG